jgi:hypothetical protein
MSRNARSFGSGRQLAFHGSKRRIRALKLRDHLGWGFVWFVLWLLFILFIVIPWAGNHYP